MRAVAVLSAVALGAGAGLVLYGALGVILRHADNARVTS